jgi:hypothetical protein
MALEQQLQLFRGLDANLPGLAAGQPAWTTDLEELWIGTNGTVAGNRKVGAPNPGMFGDGSDGDVTLGSDTVLARDTYYASLDLNGWDLDCAGFKMYVNGQLTIPSGSRLHCDGAAGADGGAGGAGGAAGTTQTLRQGAAGGNAATAGGSITDAEGGAGGAGGAGAAAAGAGGTVTAPAANAGGLRHRNAAQFGAVLGAATPGWTFIGGGAGGGGGGNSGANNGGGGGAGGGFSLIVAKAIDLQAGGFISANGGDGGDGTVGFNTGGGGGGGGGVVAMLSVLFTNGGTVEVAGGAGGTGQSGGSDGTDGSAGLILDFTG